MTMLALIKNKKFWTISIALILFMFVLFIWFARLPRTNEFNFTFFINQSVGSFPAAGTTIVVLPLDEFKASSFGLLRTNVGNDLKKQQLSATSEEEQAAITKQMLELVTADEIRYDVHTFAMTNLECINKSEGYRGTADVNGRVVLSGIEPGAYLMYACYVSDSNFCVWFGAVKVIELDRRKKYNLNIGSDQGCTVPRYFDAAIYSDLKKIALKMRPENPYTDIGVALDIQGQKYMASIDRTFMGIPKSP